MISYICLILTSFAACFTRKAAFAWFVAMVLGLAIRTDKLGITSVVRDLSLKPEAYTCLLHFFKADSWKLSEILAGTVPFAVSSPCYVKPNGSCWSQMGSSNPRKLVGCLV